MTSNNEIVANFENKPFIDAVKKAKVGDVIKEKYADLKVIKIFNAKSEYEERLTPTVLFRKSFEKGVLLKKNKSNTFIFVPNSVLK